nr:2-C-methyl-D-erythritol 4-phosphate cytidylyltransferase [Verrucomicrobium spinosum]
MPASPHSTARPRTTAIIVAAGSSRRMGFNKLTAELLGQPVLRWTLAAFDACPDVDDVLVVVGDATRPLVTAWVAEGAFTKPVTLSEGGAERHLSVHEASGNYRRAPPSWPCMTGPGPSSLRCRFPPASPGPGRCRPWPVPAPWWRRSSA